MARLPSFISVIYKSQLVGNTARSTHRTLSRTPYLRVIFRRRQSTPFHHIRLSTSPEHGFRIGEQIFNGHRLYSHEVMKKYLGL